MKKLLSIIFALSLVFSSSAAYSFSLGGSGTNNRGTAQLYSNNNIDMVIDSQNDIHGFFGLQTSFTSNDLNFRLGKRGTDITSFADRGGNTEITTTAPHGLQADDIITITGTTNYNGEQQVLEVGSSNTFTIVYPFAGNDGSGNYILPDSFITPSPGIYFIVISLTVSVLVDNPEFEFIPYCGATFVNTFKLKTSNLTSPKAGPPIIKLCVTSKNTRLWLGVRNLTNTSDITINSITFMIFRK